MVFEVPHGDRLDGESSSRVVATLGGNGGAVAFALCCAERLEPIAERLAASETISLLTRAGLDLGWRVASTPAPQDHDLSEICKVIANLDAIVEVSAGDLGRFHGYIDDAISSAAYALEAVLGQNESAPVNAAERAREVYFQVAKEVWPTLGTVELLKSPIVHGEIERQTRDARDITALFGNGKPYSLRDLQSRSHEEGEQLVNLILGGPSKTTKADSTSFDSPTLF